MTLCTTCFGIDAVMTTSDLKKEWCDNQDAFIFIHFEWRRLPTLLAG